LGGPTTFSKEAADLWFKERGEAASQDIFAYAESVNDLIDGVGSTYGRAIIPVENSEIGATGEPKGNYYYRLAESEAKICGEVYLPVEFSVLTRDASPIKTIVSKAEALEQCEFELKRMYPRAELKAVDSTEAAAMLAAENSGVAALASKKASQNFGLLTRRASIKKTTTRFVIIGTKDCERKENEKYEKYKTSIAVFSEEDRPGYLYEVLGSFARRKINLTYVHSQAKRGEDFKKYVFFIDAEGHKKDPLLSEALREVRALGRVKDLGSYPRGRLINGSV